MYQYSPFDQRFVEERVAQFRDQTERFLAGELSADVFQQLRLRNGLYIQRLAPMLRIAVPYGTLSATQLRRIAAISRRYDKGYGHLSTRQNIQLNWPALEAVPDILQELAEVQMHCIQTSGSCIRNITTDQFAGVAADEAIDARPYCEIMRQWSTFHPEFDWLPRKFKIAVTDVVVTPAEWALDVEGRRWRWRDGGWEPVAAPMDVAQRFDDGSGAWRRIDPVPATVSPAAPFTLIDAWPSFERTPDDNVWRGAGD